MKYTHPPVSSSTFLLLKIEKKRNTKRLASLESQKLRPTYFLNGEECRANSVDRKGREQIILETCLKGKLGDFFYRLKVFIGPKLDLVSKGNFHRKAPKWVKNQLKGPKNH